MLLDELLYLMKPKTQSLAEVVVGNPLAAVEVDEIDFLGLAVGLGPLGANPLLDILRYLKLDFRTYPGSK
jgi:hypothetical protein